MKKKVEDFSDDEVMNYYYMAKWCSEHSLIQQGLTILVEAVITVLCKILKVDELDTSSRRSISSALHVFLSKKPEEVWEGENELWHKTIDFITPFRELVEPFQKLNEYRNNINHAEMNTQMTEARRFETTLVESLNELRPFFEKMSKKLNEKDEVE